MNPNLPNPYVLEYLHKGLEVTLNCSLYLTHKYMETYTCGFMLHQFMCLFMPQDVDLVKSRTGPKLVGGGT